MCHIALSVPNPKMASLPYPHETATGSLIKVPPRYSRPLMEGSHSVPSQVFWHSALSVPSPKISTLLVDQAVTVRPLVKTPPRDS